MRSVVLANAFAAAIKIRAFSSSGVVVVTVLERIRFVDVNVDLVVAADEDDNSIVGTQLQNNGCSGSTSYSSTTRRQLLINTSVLDLGGWQQCADAI